MRHVLVIAAFVGVSGCMAAEQIAEDTMRQEAKYVINAQVAQRFPGLNAAPVTDCIVDAASTQEILTIGTSALTGVTSATTDLVLAIAQRPATVSCIASNGTGLFLL